MEKGAEKLTLIINIPHISKRLRQVFMNCGIDYIEQLSSYTERDIAKLRGVGINLQIEIRSLMLEYGVSFMGSSLEELSKNKTVVDEIVDSYIRSTNPMDWYGKMTKEEKRNELSRECQYWMSAIYKIVGKYFT